MQLMDTMKPKSHFINHSTRVSVLTQKVPRDVVEVKNESWHSNSGGDPPPLRQCRRFCNVIMDPPADVQNHQTRIVFYTYTYTMPSSDVDVLFFWFWSYLIPKPAIFVNFFVLCDSHPRRCHFFWRKTPNMDQSEHRRCDVSPVCVLVGGGDYKRWWHIVQREQKWKQFLNTSTNVDWPTG